VSKSRAVQLGTAQAECFWWAGSPEVSGSGTSAVPMRWCHGDRTREQIAGGNPNEHPLTDSNKRSQASAGRGLDYRMNSDGSRFAGDVDRARIL